MEYPDWLPRSPLWESMRYMLVSELFCDVTFLVGKRKWPTKAHKMMLATASHAFYNMFVCHKDDEGPLVIDVPDIEYQTFDPLLE